MIRVQKKICAGLEAFEFFGIHKWDFRTDNLKSIIKTLTPEESKMFFIDSKSYDDIPGYIETMVVGARLYCYNEDTSLLPKARFQLKV